MNKFILKRIVFMKVGKFNLNLNYTIITRYIYHGNS